MGEYPVWFYARKEALFGWWIYSVYPDGIHRRVTFQVYWRRATAERIVGALIEHYRNGYDMACRAHGSKPPYPVGEVS